MRSPSLIERLTDRQKRDWLYRLRCDLRRDWDLPHFNGPAERWARIMCGQIVLDLAKRNSPAR